MITDVMIPAEETYAEKSGVGGDVKPAPAKLLRPYNRKERRAMAVIARKKQRKGALND